MTLPASNNYSLVNLPGQRPFLQAVIDTEEEFDWFKPFNRGRTAVGSMHEQWRAQEIFDKYQVKPTYVIDYPVATDPNAIAVLNSFVSAGRCQIGTHLHPWVNPPFAEAVLRSTSYAGNLPAALERQKIEVLHNAISANFLESPVIYKAGRYGLGPNTIDILSSLGYLVDVSMVPHTEFLDDGGPDFRGLPDRPFWLNGFGGILEIPLTRGFYGVSTGYFAGSLYDKIKKSRAGKIKLSALSRFGILNRVSLTPEGIDKKSMIRLLKSMIREGHLLFTLCYHSPSLSAGNTPYVRNSKELDSLLKSIEFVLEFFFENLDGIPTTPLAVRNMAMQQKSCASTVAHT